MRTRKPKRDCCKSCGKKWDAHLGVEGTCKKYKAAMGALLFLRVFGNAKVSKFATEEMKKIEEL